MQTKIDAFLDTVENGRGCSKHTVAAYRRNLAQFVRFADANAWRDLPLALAHDALQRYAGQLRAKGYRAASIKQKIATLRSFATFLRDYHPEHAPPVTRARIRYRQARRPMITLSSTQLDTLLRHLRQCASTAPPPGKPDPRHRGLCATRDLALIVLIAGTGLRIGEALALHLADLDLPHGRLQICGKGGHHRIVFCDISDISDALRSYLDRRARLGTLTTTALFLNARDLGPLSVRAVQLRLKTLAAELGLPDALSPHTLRHTYATLAIERGANVKAVSQLLGHADIRTTLQFYTHLSIDHLAEVFRLCHPLRDNRISLPEVVNNRKKMLPYLR